MISDIKKLIKELNNRINNKRGLIIGIDGYDGSGKTTLGKGISGLLNIKKIDLDDDYLIKKKGNFINSIKDKKLTEDIKSFIKKGNLIISGACLIKILERNNFNLDILIYVKRHDKFGMYWQDEDDCTVQGDSMAYIVKKMEIWRDTPLYKDKKINKEDFRFRADIIKYHQEYKPHEKANIIFKRIEKET